ncbi:unnamed protein product, partial [Didymodactylos carnosus]
MGYPWVTHSDTNGLE